jgi:Fe-S oxidoreductase
MSIEDYVAEMERCSACSLCAFIPFDHVKSQRFSMGCPSTAYHRFLSYSARGRYQVARSLVRNQSQYSDQVLEIAYSCQTCGSCDVSCKICRYNLEPLAMIHEWRAKLVEDGQIVPQHRNAIRFLEKQCNMVLKARKNRGRWSAGLGIANAAERKTPVLFHAGCRYSYDKDLQRVARTAVTIMKKAGVDVGILDSEESCCGGRAYTMGYQAEFRSCARKYMETWAAAGIRTIVTPCADCYHAFKRLYPPLGGDIEVLHTVEFIERLIQDGKIEFKKPVPMSVTYHDPCHLGRQGEPYVPWKGKEKKIQNQIIVYEPRKPRYSGIHGVYDPPRNILKSIPGIELLEMERRREYAWCCGYGGGVKEAYPDFSLWTANERIEEARATGAKAIVSACSGCERNFLDALSKTGEAMKVYDVIDLVRYATE